MSLEIFLLLNMIFILDEKIFFMWLVFVLNDGLDRSRISISDDGGSYL